MKQSLSQQPQLKQQLRLTPQMRYFLEIIQMPITELSQFIEEQLQQNPLLEEESPTNQPQDSDQSVDTTTQQQELLNDSTIEDLYIPVKEQDFKPEEKTQPQLTYQINWREKLFNDLSLLFKSQQEKEIATYIIYNLSENGFLSISTELIAKHLNQPLNLIEHVLKIIQTNAQAGIAARNLQECLLLQIQQKEGTQSPTYTIVKNAFPELLSKKYRQIAKKLRIPLKQVLSSAEKLKTYYTHPIIEKQEPLYLHPEFKISVEDNKIIIEKLNWKLPKLKINHFYVNLLKQSKDPNTKEFLNNYLTKAKSILQAIKEREEKIYQLLLFLSERQREFVENGPAFLKPLTLSQAAKYVGLHESTISRLANNKYVQLPWGCIKIKDFFLNPLSYTNQTPRNVICKMIKDIIQNNKGKISDEAIRQKLLAEGIQISRRTVNKYRNLIKLHDNQL